VCQCRVKGVKDSLGDWSSHALSASTSLSATLAAVRTASGGLSDRAKKASDTMGLLHDLSGYAPNEIQACTGFTLLFTVSAYIAPAHLHAPCRAVQIFLMDGLVTEVHRIRSLKALLAVREAAQADYTRSWVAQDKLNFQVKQVSNSRDVL
jgi:hypothetical protein